MLVPKYKIITFLDNTTFSLVQIIYSVNGYQSTQETNYWLLYDKNNDMLLPLELVSQEAKSKQTVQFADSKLELDKHKGIYTDNKSEYKLNILDSTKPIYKQLKNALDDYILLLSFKR